MATKTRLPNKTIWALEDISARCRKAGQHWSKAMARAKGNLDPIMVTALAELRNEMAEIERQVRDARNGEYNEGERG